MPRYPKCDLVTSAAYVAPIPNTHTACMRAHQIRTGLSLSPARACLAIACTGGCQLAVWRARCCILLICGPRQLVGAMLLQRWLKLSGVLWRYCLAPPI